MKRKLGIVRGALALLLFATISVQAQVTFDRLLNTDKEPQNWLTYSGNVLGQRYSLLNQINTGNVKNLELQWIWQAPSLEKYETTSIVLDGSSLHDSRLPLTRHERHDGNTQIVRSRRRNRTPVLDGSRTRFPRLPEPVAAASIAAWPFSATCCSWAR